MTTPVPAFVHPNETARKKRLGQYFTGTSLAGLLAALAGASTARSVLDPMAGTGDMLLACTKRGAGSEAIAAVDIDPMALGSCIQRVDGCRAIVGNAFDPLTLRELPPMPWDLVITNPPYVRYQSLATASSDDLCVPSGEEVRKGLLASLDEVSQLEAEDRAFFQQLASGYSGLADLAVPSWILCAALVRRGGVLAMVVPASWLSRDYAVVVRYLLLRWFKITYVVEDADGSWFSEASVRTTLLIAERVDRRPSAFDWTPDDGFLRIRLSSQAAGRGGLVDKIFPDEADPEQAFAACARGWLLEKTAVRNAFVDAQWLPSDRVAQNLRQVSSKQKWLPKLENRHHADDNSAEFRKYNLPQELAEWLGNRRELINLTGLEGLGANIGQGLRTGANSFFYGDTFQECAFDTVFTTSHKFGPRQVVVPTASILPVLRKQSELPSGYEIDESLLSGRVLALQKWALPEDIKNHDVHALEVVNPRYHPMPDSLAALVRAAAAANFGDDQNPKRIWELSAVAPNVRGRNEEGVGLIRFWYMLPEFMPRHRPNLLIARVNHGSPKTLLNKGRKAIIDANFSTLWMSDDSFIDSHAALAILNSTWCRTALELTASIMGGGALKVEATHLRQMPVPLLTARARASFTALGISLCLASGLDAERILRSIDDLMATLLLADTATPAQLADLQSINRACLARRTKKG